MASREQKRRSRHLSSEKIDMAEKKKTNHPVMWIVSLLTLVVIIVAFVGAPIAGKISSGNTAVFGSYDGQAIIYYDGSYFADQIASIADNYSDAITDANSQFIQYQVWRTAFDNTVIRTAMIVDAQNSGLNVSGNAVDKAIVSYGPFMENGEFSENLYSQSSNIEKKNVRSRLKEELIFNEYLTDIYSINGSEAEADFLKDIAASSKSFNYVVYNFSDFPLEKAAEYAESNSNLFENATLSKITINTDRKDAEQVLEKLNANPEMFSELAKTQSSDPYADKGGEIGETYYYELKNLISDADAVDAIFSLPMNGISDIVENETTWVIYQVTSEIENLDTSNESSLEKVKTYMSQFEKGIIEDYFTDLAQEFIDIASTSGFENAGILKNTAVHETNYAPLVYGNPSVSYYGQNIPVYTQLADTDGNTFLSNASFNEYFLKSINKLENDDVSEPLILNNQIIVMQLKDIKEVENNELESIPSMVAYSAQTWQSERERDIVFASDKFEDNFTEVFTRIFVSN